MYTVDTVIVRSILTLSIVTHIFFKNQYEYRRLMKKGVMRRNININIFSVERQCYYLTKVNFVFN